MKRKLSFFIFIIGFIILIYPFMSKLIYLNTQTIVISKYDNKIKKTSKENIEKTKEDTNIFNTDLYQNNIFNSNSKKLEVSNIDFLEKNEPIAYISIPKINVNLPIYKSTSENINEILDSGIALMENTSIPCGGINTHSVLCGHTGTAKSVFFDDIDKLEKGDIFYIKFLNELLAYQVSEIKTVLPSETEDLKIHKGKDLVTLVTCTPRYVNTHRLLITGERININNEDINLLNDKITNNMNKKVIYKNSISVFTLILVIVFLILFINKKRKVR